MKISIRHEKIIVCLSFIFLFLIGISHVDDYGVTWDEYNSFDFGYRWYKYTYGVIVDGASLIPNHAETQADIIHGPFIEMSYALLIDKIFNFQDSREIILTRHYCAWLLFYFGTIMFYFLCKHLFHNRLFALLGCLILVLHPRIFADAYYNTIDIALLTFYLISFFTLLRHIDLKTWQTAIVHAITCAILIDIRVIGVIVPFLTYVIYLIELLKSKPDRNKFRKTTLNIVIFSVVLSISTILFWPYLWRHPFWGVIEIIKQTPQILWGDTVLYFGKYIRATQLPWHYIPVWISITTPLLYSLWCIIGLFFILKNFISKKFSIDYETKWGLTSLSFFLLPIILVIVFNSTLYDAWRHLFFIYPALVLVSLFGISNFYKLLARFGQRKSLVVFKIILITIFLLSFYSTIQFITTNHPHQNVYFNILAGRDMKRVKENFELDYWGLSYRQALEHIIKNDENKNIKLYDAITIGPMTNNIKILPASDRQRLTQVWSPNEADYVLTNYRWHKQDYPYLHEYFSIKVGNAKIMSVFKTKN